MFPDVVAKKICSGAQQTSLVWIHANRIGKLGEAVCFVGNQGRHSDVIHLHPVGSLVVEMTLVTVVPFVCVVQERRDTKEEEERKNVGQSNIFEIRSVSSAAARREMLSLS